MADTGYQPKVYRKDGGNTQVVADGGQIQVDGGGRIVYSTAKTQTKSDNYTMTEGDSGVITYVDTDAKTITLPATVVGMVFTVVNAGEDGAVAVTISPNAADKIMGCGLTSADNKDLVNTKATAKKGDRVKLVGDGVNGWFIAEMVGTWAREA